MKDNPFQARKLRRALHAGLVHFSWARLSRAILGGEPSRKYEASENASLSFGKPEVIYDQLVPIFERERARGAETRRRSEQAFTRLLSVATLVAALTTWAFAHADSVPLRVVAWLGTAATLVLAVAVVAIMNNLGKNEWYEPVDLIDFTKQGSVVRPLEKEAQIREYIRAIHEYDARNGDAADRLHTSHALTGAAVLVLIVASLIVAAAWSFHPPTASPPTPACSCECVSPGRPSSSGQPVTSLLSGTMSVTSGAARAPGGPAPPSGNLPSSAVPPAPGPASSASATRPPQPLPNDRSTTPSASAAASSRFLSSPSGALPRRSEAPSTSTGPAASTSPAPSVVPSAGGAVPPSVSAALPPSPSAEPR